MTDHLPRAASDAGGLRRSIKDAASRSFAWSDSIGHEQGGWDQGRGVERRGWGLPRCFWEATSWAKDNHSGGEVGGRGEVGAAKVNPRFMHTNATSHKWTFGALAEVCLLSPAHFPASKCGLHKDRLTFLRFLNVCR